MMRRPFTSKCNLGTVTCVGKCVNALSRNALFTRSTVVFAGRIVSRRRCGPAPQRYHPCVQAERRWVQLPRQSGHLWPLRNKFDETVEVFRARKYDRPLEHGDCSAHLVHAETKPALTRGIVNPNEPLSHLVVGIEESISAGNQVRTAFVQPESEYICVIERRQFQSCLIRESALSPSHPPINSKVAAIKPSNLRDVPCLKNRLGMLTRQVVPVFV